MSGIVKKGPPSVIKSPQCFARITNNNEEQSLLAEINKYVSIFTVMVKVEGFLWQKGGWRESEIFWFLTQP